MITFDQKFARLLLEICRYTYATSFTDDANVRGKRDALDWINQAGAPCAIEILNDGKEFPTSVACVVAYPDKNIVSYMGTKTEFNTPEELIESIKDWYENIEVKLVPFKLSTEQLGLDHPDKENLGGLVHKGFLDEFSAIQEKVIQQLLNHGGRGKPVYVTGHSQGGAEAALATRALIAGNFPVVATYTFAAPRPGNRDFANSIPSTLPVHRVEFGDDIVPHLPPTLVSTNVRAIVEGLLKIPLLPKLIEDYLNLLKNIPSEFSFVGIGRLCYGSNETRALRVDISVEQEAILFNKRLMGLVSNIDHWAEHHHLAGTSTEINRGDKGNYTALISEFQMVA